MKKAIIIAAAALAAVGAAVAGYIAVNKFRHELDEDEDLFF